MKRFHLNGHMIGFHPDSKVRNASLTDFGSGRFKTVTKRLFVYFQFSISIQPNICKMLEIAKTYAIYRDVVAFSVNLKKSKFE